MKRIFTLVIALLFPLTLLSACAQPEQASGEKPVIVCTIFPQYDWVHQILGEKADEFDITLLLQSRVDLHSYQPSVDDIVMISNADLFIHVGGQSDDWVDDALSQAVNSDMIVINLMDILGDGAKIEEIVEGMEDDHDHDDHEHEDEHDEHEEDHEHEDEHDEHEEDHEHEDEYDEHVWLSLKNAQIFCTAIAEALAALDPDGAEQYQSNLASYTGKLSQLDAQYKAAVDEAAVKTLLFGDRFPFRYLTDDYNISYYAAFVGCSTETEASFDTIIFLATKVDELSLRSIIVTESSDQSIARTIIDNTQDKNQQILVMNALQSVGSRDIQSEVTYITVMESNLDVLKQALS